VSKPPVRRQATLPMLAAMMSLIVIMLVMSLWTGEWFFFLLGLVGFGAGLVPIISRR
jgi:1,4-dihydroxy-2-naphthoate octaprenyltransferase